MSREKKRKMDGLDAQTSGEGAGSAAAASTVPAASVQPSAAAAAAADGDDHMRDTADPASDDEDDAEEAADGFAAASSAVPTSSPEAVAALVAALPATLSVLAQLREDAATCKDPKFHALRKEVLRLAATIQNVRGTRNAQRTAFESRPAHFSRWILRTARSPLCAAAAALCCCCVFPVSLHWRDER